MTTAFPASLLVAALAFGALGGHAASAHAQSADERSQAVLTAAREALGGAGRFAALKTLVANGRTRQVRGDNLVPIEFEIQVELPDKYARRDEFPAQDAGPVTSGFAGDQLVQSAAAGRGAAPGGAATEAAARARVIALKHDFARLMLGLFASGPANYPLAFTHAGVAEAPQGKADVLDVSGPDGFSARLFVDSQSRLPIMISWQARPAIPPGRGGAARGTPGPAPAPGAVPPTTGPGAVENRLYLAEYRDVDGFKLPFRIRRAAGADTIEETTFDRFRINARVDPRRFGVQ